MVDDLENLIEDQHSVEPVESGRVEVVDLSCQASQASERGHEVPRLHFASFPQALRWDNLPLPGPNENWLDCTGWILLASLVTVKQGFVQGEIRISPQNLLIHFFHLMIFVDIFPCFICPFMIVLSAPNVWGMH